MRLGASRSVSETSGLTGESVWTVKTTVFSPADGTSAATKTFARPPGGTTSGLTLGIAQPHPESTDVTRTGRLPMFRNSNVASARPSDSVWLPDGPVQTRALSRGTSSPARVRKYPNAPKAATPTARSAPPPEFPDPRFTRGQRIHSANAPVAADRHATSPNTAPHPRQERARIFFFETSLQGIGFGRSPRTGPYFRVVLPSVLTATAVVAR